MENENSGYDEEMEEAKVLDHVRLDQRDTILMVLKSQIVILHNRSHEAEDLTIQMQITELIVALAEAYYMISDL